MTDLDVWNAATQRAMDAYHQDRSYRAGLCITCNRRPEQRHRECPKCRFLRYKDAREAS